MFTLFVFIILIILELLYFKVADHYNIIDKPNQRSSHTGITIRGGGIIFYFAAFIFFMSSGFCYPWFFLGLSLMTIVSFLDDIYTLPNKPRLIVHFISVLLMTFELGIFTYPWYYLIFTFIFIVGVINAYNFMDGINGITVCYSISICLLLIYLNYSIKFVNNDLLIFTLISLIVFGFFNFRNKAKSFAGDVGSVSIAYILLFIIGLLIIKTENFIYILFLAVYGIDSILTIVMRLVRKENIFKAHRSHLYQYLANEAMFNKLAVSMVYGFVQFILGIFVIYLTKFSSHLQLYISILMLIVLSLSYLLLKRFIVNKYVCPIEKKQF